MRFPSSLYSGLYSLGAILVAQLAASASFAGVALVSVTITSTESDPTNANPIPLNVAFGEDVSDFTESDIMPTNGTLSDFGGSGADYSVNIIPGGGGTVSVAIAESTATGDVSALGNEAANFDIEYSPAMPDLRLGNKRSIGSHAGNNNYTGVKLRQKNIRKRAKFFGSIENDGSLPDSITGRSKRTRSFKVKYIGNGIGNITGALMTGRLSLDLDAGQIQSFRAQVKTKKKSTRPSKFKDLITVTSENDLSANDKGKVEIKFLPEITNKGAKPRSPRPNVNVNIIP